MFIKSLTLKNIRSYTDVTVDFTSGITLLAGDIGCGKTTILIALEFALFGILRGKTFPAELLRHGEKKGLVTLDCEIDGHEVIVTRSLRRTGSNIAQSAGSIIIDGVQEDLVATELKARILILLGYPDSLLSKSSNLFRYTVYTPQEHVKHILQESVEERKDIIRKIFNIDKYKIVAENSGYYQNDLRVRVERLKGQLDDLKTLKEQLASQERELVTIQNMLPMRQVEFDKASSARKLAEEALAELRKKSFERENLVKQSSLVNANLLSSKELEKLHIKRESIIIKQLATPLKEVIFDKDKLEKLTLLLGKIREKFALLNKKFGELNAKKFALNDTSVQYLKICPTCKQEVSSVHKDHVRELQEKQLLLISKKELELNNLKKILQEKEKLYFEKQDELRKSQQAFIVYEQEKKQREFKEKDLEKLSHDKKSQEEKTNLLFVKLSNFEKQLSLLPIIKTDDSENQLRQLRIVERDADNALVALKTKARYATDKLNTLNLEIEKKIAVQGRVTSLSNLRNWVTDLLIPLVGTIEKKTLYKVYQEFHSYFVTWFSMLVEDDDLIVRLDEEFTPRVSQHGFDTTIDNLSGGEKTSVALAYRLALNKVLNDYFGTLHTKGLLVLDEPTDGFSSEQIDKLRDVLEQMNVTQLIIVSHEQRLESLANTVIRVSKSNHESIIL